MGIRLIVLNRFFCTLHWSFSAHIKVVGFNEHSWHETYVTHNRSWGKILTISEVENYQGSTVCIKFCAAKTDLRRLSIVYSEQFT